MEAIKDILKFLSPKLNANVEPIDFLFAIIFIFVLAIVLSKIINFIIFAGEKEAKALKVKTK